MRATAFGIDVWSATAPQMLAGARAQPTGRGVELWVADLSAERLEWPPCSRLLGAQRLPDGSDLFTVREDDELGWLLSGEELGAHWLSADGRRLRCMPGTASVSSWQRFLIAQVLPFAAAVRGLELLHASAVVLDARAVAVTGPSGAGKSTLASELCRRGASFLADDVLAIEVLGRQPHAHPGSPCLSVGRGASEKMVSVSGHHRPEPLADLLVLERDPLGAGVALEPLGDGRTLLSSSFNLMLRDGDRAARLLEVCALLASGARLTRVRAGADVDPAELAEAVMEHLGEAP